MSRILVVQNIRIVASLESPELVASIRRTLLPEPARVLLPPATEANFVVLQHLVREGMHPYYGPPEELILLESAQDFTLGGVTIQPHPHITRLSYEYSVSEVGAPRRSRWPRQFEVRPGEWVQFACNGRFSSWTDLWYYARSVFNVGLFDAPTGREFTETEPVERYRDLARLW